MSGNFSECAILCVSFLAIVLCSKKKGEFTPCVSVFAHVHVFLSVHICVCVWTLIMLLLPDSFSFLFQGVPMASVVLVALVSYVYCIV